MYVLLSMIFLLYTRYAYFYLWWFHSFNYSTINRDNTQGLSSIAKHNKNLKKVLKFFMITACDQSKALVRYEIKYGYF